MCSALVLCASSSRQIEVVDLASSSVLRRIDDAHSKPGTLYSNSSGQSILMMQHVFFLLQNTTFSNNGNL
jgi:hypothetical protein